MALGSATTTTAAAYLKTIYKGYETTLYKDSPLFGLVSKHDDFVGDGTMNFAVQHGGGQGAGGDLTSAIANQSSNLSKRFAVTRAKLYGTGKIDGDLIRASKNDNGALARQLDQEQKNLTKTMKRHLQALTWGNGGGAFGRVSAISGSTFTLYDPTQSVWFEKDMRINMATADGTSGALHAGTLTISAVNRRTGVITCTAGIVATIAAAVVDNYVFVVGNHGATNTMQMGVDGWIPISDPTATTFFGVDRSSDVSRLGGIRYLAGAGGAIEECLQMGAAELQKEGASPDTLFMNPVDVQKLATALSSKAVLMQPFTKNAAAKANGEVPEVGYEGFRYVTPMGRLEVYADHGCPINRAYALQMDTWELHTMGDYPMFIEEDGLMMLRSATADTFEWRMVASGNLVCTAPGSNGVIQLA